VKNAACLVGAYENLSLNSSTYRVPVGIEEYKNMTDYRTLDDITEEYLRNHLEEIDDYTSELFEEYAEDGDLATLLSSLRVVRRIKGLRSI
jgi:hypothetical protein